MAKLMIAQAESKFREETYTPEFLKYKGYYNRIPPFRSAINALSDAVTSSWNCTGNKGAEMAKIVSGFNGNGKETFKMMMNNAHKVFTLCGDSYFEIVTTSDLDIENIVMLPSENIRQIIKNNRLKRYEEIDGGEKWKPEQILHFAWNPTGAMTHGESDVEPLINLLLHLDQLWDNMAKIFNRYIKPITIVGLNTDDPTEIANFKAQWAKLREIPESDLIIPSELVQKIERVAIPQGGVLDPTTWERILVERILQANRVPDLALGTGTINSEESARMKFSGLRHAVRYRQQFMEDVLQKQLFTLQFPEDPPNIRFNFAAEPDEEKYNRILNAYNVIGASPINDEIKGLILLKLLQDIGIVPDE